MGKKELLKDGLEFARNYTCSLFAQFKTLDEWLHQTHPNANHALWCAGHLANTDNFALGFVAPDKKADREDFRALFGGGSTPSSDPSKYPAPEEVLAYFKDRRAVLLAALDGMSEADLSKPTPDNAPEFMPTVESVFRAMIWHEGLHAGQASVAHRSLGKPPVFR